ncbi:MAG: methyl-accepting chemotaxis protein [Methylococcaceae bacterium]
MAGIKWGIARKISALTGSLLMLLVVSFIFVLSQLHKGTKTIEVQGSTLERLELVNAVNRNFSNLRYWLSDLAIGGEYETEQKIDFFRKELSGQFDVLALSDPGFVADTRSLVEQYDAMMLLAADAFISEDIPEGNKQISAGRKIAATIEQSLLTLLTESGKNAQTSRQTIISSNKFTQKTSILIVTIGVLFGGVLSWLISRTIIKPIETMRTTINTIEQNSDLSRKISIDSSDEIGEISVSVNSMLKNFRGLISQVADTTTRVKSSAESMTSITLTTSQGAAKQQSESARAAESMDEMASTVENVTRRASEVTEAVQLANTNVNQGTEVITNVLKSINDIEGFVVGVAGVIEKLNGESEKIGSVLDVIRSIADQTNLLALNAAIEAARAGEQGRGFAVVADEVRTLANRTQNSTEEIQEMIQTLQANAKEAVHMMVDGQKQTGESVSLAAVAGNSLEEINKAIDTISEISGQTAVAMEKQNETTRGINTNIHEISIISSETASQAQQVADASGQLVELSTQLEHITDQFKT